MQMIMLSYLICMNLQAENIGSLRYDHKKLDICIKEKAVCLDKSKTKEDIEKCLQK